MNMPWVRIAAAHLAVDDHVHRAPLRTFVFVAALVALIMGRADLSSVALAQGNPAPRSVNPAPRLEPQGRAESPIGHRQPRPQDLPQGLSRGEGVRTPEDEALDKKLEICRGC
jgi:hypothetical protein